VSTKEGDLTSQQVLTALSAANPYPTYHDLEVATRAYFRAQSYFLPTHYNYRDFLTWAFSNGTLARTQKGFSFSLVSAPVSA
jgi:hypothetical protein